MVALRYPYYFSCLFHCISIDYKQSNALASTRNGLQEMSFWLVILGLVDQASQTH